MKEIFKQYAGYNAWANKRLVEVILILPEEQQQQTVASSFAGLGKTLVHMWDAEAVYWQRMQLAEKIVLPGLSKPSTKEIAEGLQQQDNLWYNWVAEAKEADLEHVIAYQNSKKEHFKQPVYQMLLHLFNHSTYHRGQLVTILRQLGVETIPATDFIVWSRSIEV